MTGTIRQGIKQGTKVRVVQKQDQRTGKLTEGIVMRILTNSEMHLRGIIGVLGMIYVIYLGPYAKALGISIDVAKKGIGLVAITNGVPEAIISVIITMAVVTAINKIRKK